MGSIYRRATLRFSRRRSQPHARLLSFFLGFGRAFVWLAIAAEDLVYVAFSLTLTTWVEVKAALRQTAAHKPRAEDLRIAVFFLLFVQVAAFGAGKTVYCLVPVLDPFLMVALLVFKIVAPRIILATCFSISNARLSPPPFSLFLVALTYTKSTLHRSLLSD
ncbi:GPI ethanolamine phosphate transferase 1 [Epithele typhae]|uniref:GPI ethanolamine phosphate transferase 1 n=1 Tax=Epithele typhae TaxID=378194 RepID=UPI002007852B|nr:GPI ethanolamine phosphate transferase 1 [Epithele typhae]KAH9925588.1 GPI ethanolamine phosphate transferase 1 [Epithele typhae]